MAGRPTKITPAVVAKLERALEAGFTITKACVVSGISYDAYNERYNADAKFRQKMELAKNWATEEARQVVVSAIKDKNLGMAKWWLERKAKDEFTTQPETPLAKTSDYSNMSDEELAEFTNRTHIALVKWDVKHNPDSQYLKDLAEALKPVK